MKKCFCVLTLMAVCVSAFAAKDLLKADDINFWRVSRGKVVSNADGVIRVTLPCFLVLKHDRKIKLEKGKYYGLSGEFRYIGEEAMKQPLWLGYTGYTNGRYIFRENTNRISRIFAKVAADAPAGATSVELSGNIAQWQNLVRVHEHYMLAFGAKADKSDLPNFRISSGIAKKGIVKLENGNWKYTFRHPLRFAVKAGESVGLHYVGATYLFVEQGKKFGSEWTKFYGSYSDTAGEDVSAFYPKQTEAGIAFFCHNKGGEIEFRNIRIIDEE